MLSLTRRYAVVSLSGILPALIATQSVTGQARDPRIVVGSPDLDADGDRIHDQLTVKVATGTLIGRRLGDTDRLQPCNPRRGFIHRQPL